MTQIELDVARTTIRANKAVANHLERIDWEQRRYEIAKDMLPYCLERSEEIRKLSGGVWSHKKTPEQSVASFAVSIADALIGILKGGLPCEE